MPYKPSSELDDLIQELLGEEKPQFFDSIANPLPHTIRFNSLKGDREKLIFGYRNVKGLFSSIHLTISLIEKN